MDAESTVRCVHHVYSPEPDMIRLIAMVTIRPQGQQWSLVTSLVTIAISRRRLTAVCRSPVSRRSLCILRPGQGTQGSHRGASCVTSDQRENHQAESSWNTLRGLKFTREWTEHPWFDLMLSHRLYTLLISLHYTTWTLTHCIHSHRANTTQTADRGRTKEQVWRL